METKDIKLPLRYGSQRLIVTADCDAVIEVRSDGCDAEAVSQLQELVVVACNSHALLVEAATDAKAMLERQKWRPSAPDPESVVLRKLTEALAAAGAA